MPKRYAELSSRTRIHAGGTLRRGQLHCMEKSHQLRNCEFQYLLAVHGQVEFHSGVLQFLAAE
jgi:hypothetical protein